jgi:hypothetical protein
MPAKKNQVKSQPTVEKLSVVEPVTAPVEQQAGAPKAKASRAKKTDAPVAAPVVVAVAPVETKPKGKGKAKAAAPVVAAPEVPVEAAPEKKKRAPKKEAKPVETTEATEPTEVLADGERHIRSFKVKLPGYEAFEGRFTGLTPYQAANKALSKYFRESQVQGAEVTFSICESTRKSKKSVYTYVGRRHQLEVPVRYTIQNGREIVKNYKNSLKKVKKTELHVAEATTTA